MRKRRAASPQAELRCYADIRLIILEGKKNVLYFSAIFSPPLFTSSAQPSNSEVQNGAVSAGAFTPLTLLLYTPPCRVPPLWPPGQLKHASVDSPSQIRADAIPPSDRISLIFLLIPLSPFLSSSHRMKRSRLLGLLRSVRASASVCVCACVRGCGTSGRAGRATGQRCKIQGMCKHTHTNTSQRFAPTL